MSILQKSHLGKLARRTEHRPLGFTLTLEHLIQYGETLT